MANWAGRGNILRAAALDIVCGWAYYLNKDTYFGAYKMAEQKKSWEKRLSGEPDELTVDFVESLSVDKRLYKYDIVGSIAHAQMLAEQKLITKSEFKAIKEGLLEISEKITNGKFKFDKTYEDIHMAIDAALVAKIGEAGKKLHTGRSRNLHCFKRHLLNLRLNTRTM